MTVTRTYTCDDLITIVEASRRYGIPRTRIDHWHARGHIEPVGMRHGSKLFLTPDIATMNLAASVDPRSRENRKYRRQPRDT